MNPLGAPLLGNLPGGLRTELFDEYNKLVKNYRESRWEPTEMGGGKICEIIYSIINGYVTGNFPVSSFKPNNMVDACKQLEQAPSTFPRSVRIQVPRVLIALYEIRNNRGAGHVGGDVNPNHMDATFVLSSSKWLLSELIRIFHNVDTTTAQDAIESITTRETPLIWNIDGLKRVLNVKLSKQEQTLVLLHQNGSVPDKVLRDWIEYSNFSVYQKRILFPGHKNRLWEYNASNGIVTISANGITEAEKILSTTN